MLVLRWISEKAEQTFRNFAKTRYGNHKGNEKRTFQDLMSYIESEEFEKSFKKWLVNRTQSNPLE